MCSTKAETNHMFGTHCPVRMLMAVPGLSRSECVELLKKFGTLREVILAPPQQISVAMGWTMERANEFCSFFENDVNKLTYKWI